MTVIAWDGTTLAADKLSNYRGIRGTVTKIWRLSDGRLFGGSGDFGAVIGLKDHLDKGAPLPVSQSDKDDWALAMLVERDGGVYIYERWANRFRIENPFYAIGSGAEYAMGAMGAGVSAARAVEIASERCTTCGGGVDILQLSPSVMFDPIKVLLEAQTPLAPVRHPLGNGGRPQPDIARIWPNGPVAVAQVEPLESWGRGY